MPPLRNYHTRSHHPKMLNKLYRLLSIRYCWWFKIQSIANKTPTRSRYDKWPGELERRSNSRNAYCYCDCDVTFIGKTSCYFKRSVTLSDCWSSAQDPRTRYFARLVSAQYLWNAAERNGRWNAFKCWLFGTASMKTVWNVFPKQIGQFSVLLETDESKPTSWKCC